MCKVFNLKLFTLQTLFQMQLQCTVYNCHIKLLKLYFERGAGFKRVCNFYRYLRTNNNVLSSRSRRFSAGLTL